MKDHSSLESSIEISTDVNLVSVEENFFEHTQDVFNLIGAPSRFSRAVDVSTETTGRTGFSRNPSY
jgi:hypothetical protein